jgi:hypothetical protein
MGSNKSAPVGRSATVGYSVCKVLGSCARFAGVLVIMVGYLWQPLDSFDGDSYISMCLCLLKYADVARRPIYGRA